MDWSVYVQAAGPADATPLDEAAVDRFAENLRTYSPVVTGAVAPEQERIWSAQLTVSYLYLFEDEPEPVQAAKFAVDLVTAAAHKAGLPPWPVVKLEVTEWERFDAELDQPNTPDLVGIAELAELVGVTRQRASALARHPGFPSRWLSWQPARCGICAWSSGSSEAGHASRAGPRPSASLALPPGGLPPDRSSP